MAEIGATVALEPDWVRGEGPVDTPDVEIATGTMSCTMTLEFGASADITGTATLPELIQRPALEFDLDPGASSLGWLPSPVESGADAMFTLEFAIVSANLDGGGNMSLLGKEAMRLDFRLDPIIKSNATIPMPDVGSGAPAAVNLVFCLTARLRGFVELPVRRSITSRFIIPAAEGEKYRIRMRKTYGDEPLYTVRDGSAVNFWWWPEEQ